MAETTIWQGTSSHWKNFQPYMLTFLSIPAAAAIHWWLADKGVGLWIYTLPFLLTLWAGYRWLLIRTTCYHLTTERLVTTHGILTKVTDTLELYRVRDLQIVQPLLLRIVGLKNVHVITSDASTAEVILDFIPGKIELGEKMRLAVERCREAKRVRSLDMVNEKPGDHVHADGEPLG